MTSALRVTASILALTFPFAATAQTKAQLAYNGDKDAAFLIIRGTNDNRAARLSVDSTDNTRGFLHLYQDDGTRARFYVDGVGQGGLILEQSDGDDAVTLAVDNDSDHGLLYLRDASGGVRAVLMVDDDRQGHLVLDGSDGAARSTLYVDGQNEGGLRLERGNGGDGATLFIEDSGGGGSLRLHGRNGDGRARLRVDSAGRGQLTLDGNSDQQRASLYIDGVDQGGLRLRGSGNNTAANLWVADSSDSGYLTLHTSSGVRRARLRVDGNGRGQLDLTGADGGTKSALYTDGVDQGGLRLQGSTGNRAATLYVSDSSDAGALSLHASGGEARARLRVTNAGHGRLDLEDGGDATKATVYVDAANQGGLRLDGTGGQRAVALYVSDSTDAGNLELSAPDGTARSVLRVNGDGRGILTLDTAANTTGARLFVDTTGQGDLLLLNAAGNAGAELGVEDATDNAALRLNGMQGDLHALVAVTADTHGEVSLADQDSIEKARLALDAGDASGRMVLRGQRSWPLVSATTTDATMPNDGAVRVFGAEEDGGSILRGELVSDQSVEGGILTLFDQTGAPTIVLDGSTGVITKAGLNGFLIIDPRNARREIFYASLEGPEAGIYARGTAKMVSGRAEVRLPDHFRAVARPGSLTVQLTPHSTETMGLAILKKSVDGLVVGELGKRRGSFAFDYVVHAERGDIAPIVPVRDRKVRAAGVRGKLAPTGQRFLSRTPGKIAAPTPDHIAPIEGLRADEGADPAAVEERPLTAIKFQPERPDSGVRRDDLQEDADPVRDVSLTPALVNPSIQPLATQPLTAQPSPGSPGVIGRDPDSVNNGN